MIFNLFPRLPFFTKGCAACFCFEKHWKPEQFFQRIFMPFFQRLTWPFSQRIHASMQKPCLVRTRWSKMEYLGTTLVLSLVDATPCVQLWVIFAMAPTKSSDLTHQWNLGFMWYAPQHRWMKLWCLYTILYSIRFCSLALHACNHGCMDCLLEASSSSLQGELGQGACTHLPWHQRRHSPGEAFVHVWTCWASSWSALCQHLAAGTFFAPLWRSVPAFASVWLFGHNLLGHTSTCNEGMTPTGGHICPWWTGCAAHPPSPSWKPHHQYWILGGWIWGLPWPCHCQHGWRLLHPAWCRGGHHFCWCSCIGDVAFWRPSAAASAHCWSHQWCTRWLHRSHQAPKASPSWGKKGALFPRVHPSKPYWDACLFARHQSSMQSIATRVPKRVLLWRFLGRHPWGGGSPSLKTNSRFSQSWRWAMCLCSETRHHPHAQTRVWLCSSTGSFFFSKDASLAYHPFCFQLPPRIPLVSLCKRASATLLDSSLPVLQTWREGGRCWLLPRLPWGLYARHLYIKGRRDPNIGQEGLHYGFVNIARVGAIIASFCQRWNFFMAGATQLG